MNQIKRNIICLSLAAALASGCASNTRLSDGDHEAAAPVEAEGRGHNPGADVAYGCMQTMRLGPLGVPIMLMCLPLAVAVAVINVVPGRVNDGTGAPNFAYPNANAAGCRPSECDWPVASPSQVTDTPNFAFPVSSSSGCRWGECDGRPQDRPYGGRGSSGFAYPNSYIGCNGGRWC